MTSFIPKTFSLHTLAAVCLGLAAAATHAQDVQVVKIGHAGPTSGGIAHIGKDTENGVRLAIEEFNAQNLVIGGKKIKFELAAEDGGRPVQQRLAWRPWHPGKHHPLQHRRCQGCGCGDS